MDNGTLHAKALFPAIGAIVAACLFSRPGLADNNVQVVPLYSDSRGNQAWVEIESAGERKKATPLVAAGDERLLKMLKNPDEKGSLAVPFPRLMRLVERARQAIRDMKRPIANAPAVPDVGKPTAAGPAAPAGESRRTPPDPTDSSAPPGNADAGMPPAAPLYETATR